MIFIPIPTMVWLRQQTVTTHFLAKPVPWMRDQNRPRNKGVEGMRGVGIGKGCKKIRHIVKPAGN
jgi:hypothetical protein